MTKLADTPQKRVALFFFIILICLLGIIGRMGYLQLVQGTKLAEKTRLQLQESRALQSPRGTIYDRMGRELAISGVTKSLYVNPKILNKDAGEIAAMLSPVLDMSEANLKERLTVDSSFMWLKRTLEPEKAKQVESLIKQYQIRGLEFVEESKRYYPNDSLAAHILGFVGTDDIGLDGIESVLDKTIKGDRQKQQLETDGYGVPIFKSILTFSPSMQGKSVYLTIDNTIQFIVEQSLDKAMVKTKAKAATAIIMNPRTGEILAMVSRPGYNPNYFGRYSEAERKNRAVSIVYEPGSTFKPLVAAAALQEGKVRADERFIDNGYVEVSGRRIQNWSGDSYGNIGLVDIIKNSINTGMVQLGLRLGSTKIMEYARNFGFGHATGINLPGEEEGILFKPGDMRDVDVATMSIGQGIAVTPLQLITALAAIANDGLLLKPHIIKEIHNADDSIESVSATTPVRQVIDPEKAKIITEMMEKEVSEGGGVKAAVKGYRFAGKTGTAEKLKESGGGYEDNHYISSFAGFGPVEDPQVVALIVIDDPVGTYYGAEIVAPIFSEIMLQVMRYLNVHPELASQVAPPPAKKKAEPAVPFSPVRQDVPQGKVVVPNVKGKTIREAAELLSKAGLAFVPVGTGLAVGQQSEANSIVSSGTVITVTFEQ